MADPKRITFDEFIEGLEKERDLYLAMAKLAATQNERITAGDADGALAVLESKGKLMSALDALEAHTGPWKAEWSTLREKLGPADREKAAILLADIEETLKKLLEVENKIQEALNGSRNKTISEIKKTQIGRQAGKAYLKPNKDDDARFIDKTQ